MDRYELIEKLGEGGFGKAYLYERKLDKARFVIKILNAAALTPQETADSIREVQVLKKLEHPNVVHFEDAFREGSNICIVMEYCEAGDLEKKVRSGDNISEQQKLDWFVQMCKAMQYMHSSKVVHRDLKPSNVFISQDGSLRIGDFGLSKVFLHSGGQMNSSSAGFTVGYGAPEMLEDMEYTSKCDVWSLGCIFYFMIMSKPPFDGRSPAHIMRLVMDAKYPPVPETYDQSIREVVEKMLTKDPEQRPSIGEVLEMEYVKALSKPSHMLKSTYGYSLSGGVLVDNAGNGYQWNVYINSRDNNRRFDGMAQILTDEVYSRMIDLGLEILPVPLRANPIPDFNSPGTIIFATTNWSSCEELLVLIHGSGKVKAGQWAQRVMMTKSLEEGTQLPYIRKAIECGYGVIVLNTNDNRPEITGCRSPEDHGLYVWEHYVKEASAVKIAIKAHSAGGYVTSTLFKKYEEDFKRRVFANAFTGVDPVNVPVQEYTKKVTRNWVTSDKPLGTVLSASDRCECVSAGTPTHSLTPHYAFPQVFSFIQEMFDEDTPGGL